MYTEWPLQDKDRLIRISSLLSRRYRDSMHHNKTDPVAEIVFILLSTQTEEYNYLTTYRELRRRFPTWSRVQQATVDQIALVIRKGGLARLKAAWIFALLRSICDKEGSLTLQRLHDLTDAEVEKYLISLPGVGIKTARCVMMYALGRQVFPVDAHCWRICARLGLVPEKHAAKPTRRDADSLQAIIAPDLRLPLHVNFVSLGRKVCLDPTPKCKRCVLRTLCPTGLVETAAQERSVRL